MDFAYPETHHDIKRLCTELLADFSSPERLKQLETAGPYLDEALWQKFHETGLLSVSLPEAHGGLGLGFDAATLVVEAIGESVASIPYIPCVVSTALPLAPLRSVPAVAAVLDDVAAGRLVTAGWLEPGNEDPANPAASGRQEGDRYLLSGTKHCVPYASHADKLLVSARCDGKVALFLVDTQAAGVVLLAQRSTANEPQCQVSLDNAEAQCIATGDDALGAIERSASMTTAAYCSMAIGVADRMMRIAAEYTSQREQFGVPLATFQAVSHKLATCYIDVECLKISTLKAVSDLTRGHYGEPSLSVAKAWCGDVLHRVSHASQHVHGGMGIDRDYHLFRYCLWAKQLELSMGSSRAHIAKLADQLEAKYLAECG